MIMKKSFNSLFVIIAAMVTFAGCAKQEIDRPAAETKTVQFFAESIETKTAFGTPDGTSYPTLWTTNDKEVKLSLNYATPKDAQVTVQEGGETARFVAEVSDDASGAYVFYALSPATSYNNFHAANKYLSATIPTAQTPLANSVDESAQILYAVSDEYSEMPESVALNFKHFTAYGKLSFINLNLGDAKVTSVSVTSSVNFANRWNYFVEEDRFAENSGASTVTLNTDATENLWFACAPIGSMDGKSLTFTINTDKGPLSKTVTLSGDKYNFEAGKIAVMKVDMGGIEFAESQVYELVKDPSELTVDSEIIIVSATSDVALSTTQNNNNRGQAAITKSSDKSTISDPGTGVQVITVEDGAVDGTVAFNVGDKGYLYAASSSSNYLRSETTLSANSSWSVEISDAGVATVKAQGTNTRNWLRYNSNSSLFSCYGSGQGDICIYKLRGTGSAPLPKLAAPTVTAELNADETGFDVSWTAVENAEEYVLSCSGQEDVTISETSYSFEDMSAGTYTIIVTAKAEGYKSAKSAAVSVVVPSQGGTGEAVTETLDIKATAGVLTSDKSSISWAGTNFTCTNVKGATAIRTTDSDHYRVYKGSTLKFTSNSSKTFNKVVVTCTSADYAKKLETSATNAGLGVSVSSGVVTITNAQATSEISIEASEQFRINKIEATLN